MKKADTQQSSWSVSQYAAAFVFLVMMIFITLSSFVYVKLQPILIESHKDQENLAREEFSRALKSAIQLAQSNVSAIANWDEARQQIGQPVYYTYWHDHRVNDSALLSKSVIDVDLYNINGTNLDHSKVRHVLPLKMTPDNLGIAFTQESGGIYIYAFSPIQLSDKATQEIGYAGIKIDFHNFLEASGSVHIIKLNSLHLSENVHHVTNSGDILGKINYQIIEDASHSAVSSLLSNLLLQTAAILVFSTAGIFWFLHYRLGVPLRQLSDYIDRCRNSTLYNEPIKITNGLPVAELEKVRKSLSDYQSQLVVMQGNLEKSNAQLWTQAHHDPLTGAYNRRAFDEDWEQIRALSQRHEVNVCFILFDCDHFKTINDTYGHNIGDEVIRIIAEILSSMLRNGEKLYRLGGDEFACLLTDATSDEGYQAANRAERVVASYNFKSLCLEPVRISVGIAHYRGQNPLELDKLSKQADIAMYLAKRPGNNKVTAYNESMAEIADSIISSMETSAVYETLKNNELIEMAYQPVFSLQSNQLEYFESLVRIRYQGKLIIPGSIFPVIEAHRLEAEFDLAVVASIARDLDMGAIPKGKGISINISGPGILNLTVIEKLNSIATWTSDYKLVIEITETALITQIGFASANLEALRKLGFYIALDDFGSGYSSLRYLSHMPVDTVKFDISLIQGLMGEPRQRGIVENLAHLIKKAGYQMVAEGVETEEMLQKVTAVGFTHVQGFYLGKPQRPIS